MGSTGLRSALHFLASHPLIVGLSAARHLSSSEGGGGPVPADPGLAPFFEATSDPMVVFGPDFLVLMANAAACRLLRVTEAQLIGRSVLESALLARVLSGASVPQRLRGGTTVVRDEVAVVDAEGQPLQSHVEALRLPDGRVLVHLRDVTAAFRARTALRALEDLHRSAAEVLPGVAWTMALPEERLLEVSPGVERLFGRQPAAILDHHGAWDELVHPGDRERVRAEFRAGVDAGAPFDIHFTGVHQDRRDLPHLVNHVVPVRGERAWAERAHGFIEDLSARDALQQELTEARAHLRHILDAIPTGVLVARLRRGRGEVVLCNRRLAEMLRLDEPIRAGTPLSRATPDLLRLLQGGGAGESVPRLTGETSEEYVAELREPLRVLRVYAGPLRDAHGAVVGRILTAEDITAGWLMQRRLTQAQKMESMGRLAGGVAHDFNNLLGTILGFGTLLLEKSPEPDPRHEPAAQIVGAAERASRLTLALLEFSRSARFERLPLQLNRVIEDAYQVLRSALDPSVSLTLRLEPDLPLLLGDSLLLQQVLVNLAQEVRDRLGTGGALTLATRLVEQPQPSEEILGKGEARHAVALEVHAEPGSQVRRPVEPAPDRAGLTLTIVEDIVRAHGGWLVTGSGPGEAAFRAVFPVDTVEETPLLVPAAATAHGHETVLVVDDEPGLRALARTGLQQHGFDVLAVETGEQALEILRRGEPRVDAMLLDLTLPGISGESVLRETRKLAPGLPVIIASGYASVESQSSWVAAGAMSFVAKPYRIQQVAEKLREALDRPPALKS
jgi:nitrogen-specific signal transduction histidine kinase/ActR/RegA family two-component response regulator